MEFLFDLSGGPPTPMDLIVRVTVLLSVAAWVTWALRKRAASTQHLLWTTTFVVLLALPLAASFLPTWTLPVLPASLVDAHFTTAEFLDEGSSSSLGAVSQLSATSFVLWLWALGSLAALISIVAGWIRFATLVREGRTVQDAEWIEAVERLRDRLGIRRNVRLIECPSIHTAMAGGLRNPVILLPMDARGWCTDRRTAILAHELIHLRRHDPLRQLLGGIALALYWFHPLSWLAARLSVVSREQACDEGVLQLGVQPSQYATHLLELAESRGPTPTVLALPFIQRSQLERRIKAILDPRPALPLASVFCTLLIVWGLTTAVALPVSADSLVDDCPFRNYPAQYEPTPKAADLSQATDSKQTLDRALEETVSQL